MSEQDAAPAGGTSTISEDLEAQAPDLAPDPSDTAPEGAAARLRRLAPALVESLQEEYAAATDGTRRKTLPLLAGRFGDKLAVRYRPIDPEVQRERVLRFTKVPDSSENDLNYGAEVIAEACECVLLRDDAGKLVPMHELGGATEPVRFDATLAAVLGIDKKMPIDGLADSAIVRLVFRNPQALNQHFGVLEAWLQERAPGDDEEGDEERPT